MRKPTRPIGAAVFAIVIALALSACGGSSSHSSANGTTTTKNATTTAGSNTPTSGTPTTAAPAGHHYSFSTTFTTPDGYSFAVTAAATLGAPSAGNSSQLPPGQDAIVVPVSGSATVRNTTPGRVAPSDPVSDSTVMGLWKSPTPVCPEPSQGTTDATYMYLNSNVYCIVQLLTIQDPTENPITSGQTVSLSGMPMTCENQDDIPGGCGVVPTPTNDVALDYLAPHEAAAMRALAGAPDLVVLVGPEANAPSKACSPSNTLGWIVASSKPITSCS
jgi:hypothetical protein